MILNVFSNLNDSVILWLLQEQIQHMCVHGALQ